MSVYTLEEKKQFLKWYFAGSSVEDIIGRFVFTFQDRPVPTKSTVHRVIQRFESCGCITDCKKCLRIEDEPRIRQLNDERMQREILVCAAAEINDPCSSTQLAEETQVSSRTVRNILARNGYKCRKIQTTQEIFEGDRFRRMQFCEEVIERANLDENFLSKILFTDESSFPIHGRHNPSVVRYWSRENKHLHVTRRTQYPQKINVWAGILGNSIVGPIFIDGNLNARKYLENLRQQIIPAVQALQINFDEIWFQQDGCSAHNARVVQAFLQNTFPNRVISTRGTIQWPPRSPDLAPNDFFLWGHVKEKIYQHEHNRPHNLAELRGQIMNALASVTPEQLSRTRAEFYNRLGYCLAQQGGLFEHLIH